MAFWIGVLAGIGSVLAPCVYVLAQLFRAAPDASIYVHQDPSEEEIEAFRAIIEERSTNGGGSRR